MCGTHLQNNYHAEILKCELSSPECAEYDSTCVLITDFLGGWALFQVQQLSAAKIKRFSLSSRCGKSLGAKTESVHQRDWKWVEKCNLEREHL